MSLQDQVIDNTTAEEIPAVKTEPNFIRFEAPIMVADEQTQQMIDFFKSLALARRFEESRRNPTNFQSSNSFSYTIEPYYKVESQASILKNFSLIIKTIIKDCINQGLNLENPELFGLLDRIPFINAFNKFEQEIITPQIDRISDLDQPLKVACLNQIIQVIRDNLTEIVTSWRTGNNPELFHELGNKISRVVDQYLELQQLPKDSAELKEIYIKEAKRIFERGREDIIRVFLARLSDYAYLLDYVQIAIEKIIYSNNFEFPSPEESIEDHNLIFNNHLEQVQALCNQLAEFVESGSYENSEDLILTIITICKNWKKLNLKASTEA